MGIGKLALAKDAKSAKKRTKVQKLKAKGKRLRANIAADERELTLIRTSPGAPFNKGELGGDWKASSRKGRKERQEKN